MAKEAGQWDETLDLHVLVQPAPPFAILEASSDWLGFYGFSAAEVVGSPLCSVVEGAASEGLDLERLIEEAAAFVSANPGLVGGGGDVGKAYAKGGGFGTPNSVGSLKFDHGSPGSADGSPENNLDAMTKLSSEEAQAAVALAKSGNVDIDSPPESHGSGKSSVHTPSPQSTRLGASH